MCDLELKRLKLDLGKRLEKGNGMMSRNKTRLSRWRKGGLGLICLLMLAIVLAACSDNSGTSAASISVGSSTGSLGVATKTAVPQATNTSSPNNIGVGSASQGNHQLFVEPDDGVTPLVNGLNSAKTNIDMVMYLLTDRSVISALTSAQQRGVAVRVMLEQHPYGGGSGNGAVFTQLQKAGVQVKWSNPVFSLTHEKSVVLDNRVAFIMTLNSTASAFSKNREYGVMTFQPTEVQEVEAGFNADWNRTAFKPPLNSPLIWSNNNSRQKILAFIDGAQHTLVMQQEEMQDSEVQQHLVQAVKRGVKIRVLVAAASGGTDSNASGEQQLVAGGVMVETITSPYMHAKMYLADGNRVILCSENVSTASLNNNRELGIEVSDADIVSRVAQTFEKDWTKGTTFK